MNDMDLWRSKTMNVEPNFAPSYRSNVLSFPIRISELQWYGVAAQDRAASVDISHFRLPRWREQIREGVIATKNADIDKKVAAEIKGPLFRL